ncbi:hypothetical protein [Tautonia rosea]|uniref:hypothetical protein n=1 Tax=Tautonia rosea TaxID=2728037 RepID=UPI001473D4A1|nr:hypothetical protein [Tautonia rosea]
MIVPLMVLASPALAQRSGEPSSGFVDCARALNETIRSGRPTVVVISSRAVPASLGLRDTMVRDLLSSSIGQIAMFAELPVELFADRVERLGVQQFPTLLAYGSRDGALVRLGTLAGPTDTAQVAAWIGSIGLMGGGSSTTSSDPEVSQTGLFHRDPGSFVAVPVATPQQPGLAPPPPSKPHPPTSGMIPVGQAGPPSLSPVVMQESGPPVIVQQQSPTIYIQPQAPRIMLGQMPPPEITIVQGPQAAPTINYAVVGGQPQAIPNLFAVPQPDVPSYGAPSPQGHAAMPPTAYAPPNPGATIMTAAPMSGMSVAPQQSVVGTTAVAFLLQNPDVVNAMIGALGKGFLLLGEALEKHGYPRVRLPRPEPKPQTAGTMALVPAMSLPASATVPLMTVPVQPSSAPGIIPASPVYPTAVPSPQSDSGRGHHGWPAIGHSEQKRPWWKR